MSLQDVQTKAQTYFRLQGQEAQDAYMLYMFLIESLTDAFKVQVSSMKLTTPSHL